MSEIDGLWMATLIAVLLIAGIVIPYARHRAREQEIAAEGPVAPSARIREAYGYLGATADRIWL